VSRPSDIWSSKLLQAPAAGIHPDGHPSTAFRRPSRVWSSPSPVALFHATDAHGVSLSRVFPFRKPPPDSSSGDSLSTFHLSSASTTSVAPPGLTSCESPLPAMEYCIHRKARDPLELSLPRLRLPPSLVCSSSSHRQLWVLELIRPCP
jgi:hypothetical protein